MNLYFLYIIHLEAVNPADINERLIILTKLMPLSNAFMDDDEYQQGNQSLRKICPFLSCIL